MHLRANGGPFSDASPQCFAHTERLRCCGGSLPFPLAPPAGVDAASWYPVSIFPTNDNQLGAVQATAVTATWFGFLAVGRTPRGGTSWWSPDGTSWTASMYDDPALRGATLTGVAASDSRIVAIGTIRGLDNYQRAEIWTSPDGLAWTPVLKLAAGSPTVIRSITRTATTFVVIGVLDQEDPGSGRIWRSGDGLTWSTTDLAGFPLSVVAGPAGAIVVGGLDTGTEPGAAWLVDGSGQATLLSSVVAASTVAGGPDGYWAISGQAVLRSPDGVTWTRTGATPPALGQIVAAVVERDGTLVLATSQGDGVPARSVLRTRDGAAWAPVTWPTPIEADAEINALAEGRDVVAAVGSIRGRRAAIWAGQPASADAPVPPEILPVATGCPPPSSWAATPNAVLQEVLHLSPADRVRCLHDTPIRVSGYLAVVDGLGGQCDHSSTPEWLTGGCPSYPRGWLEPIAVPFGESDELDLFGHATSTAALTPGGHWVVVTGHFDDPLSTTCRDIGPGPGDVAPIAGSVAACRQHFVVTKATAIAAPTLSAANPDPAVLLGLPNDFLLAPFFEGWDNLTLPTRTTYGFRQITPLGGATVDLAAFHVVDPTSAPTVEIALIGSLGPTTSEVVLGVSVARASDGSEAVFTVGSRIFKLDISFEGTAPTSQQAASLGTVIEALIRAASAG